MFLPDQTVHPFFTTDLKHPTFLSNWTEFITIITARDESFAFSITEQFSTVFGEKLLHFLWDKREFRPVERSLFSNIYVIVDHEFISQAKTVRVLL